MSLWTRIANAFRGDGLSREIDEELQSHIEEAIEQGRDPEEARRAFGPALKQREQSRDVRIVAWIDSLRADAVFGWRRLQKSKVTAGAAILSLALAIGACTSAFRRAISERRSLWSVPTADSRVSTRSCTSSESSWRVASSISAGVASWLRERRAQAVSRTLTALSGSWRSAR